MGNWGGIWLKVAKMLVGWGVFFLDLKLWGEIWRGWIVPVGGSTPDRLRIWLKVAKMLVGWGVFFLDLKLWGEIWRGWIFPVGGSTPDRHKVGGGSLRSGV